MWITSNRLTDWLSACPRHLCADLNVSRHDASTRTAKVRATSVGANAAAILSVCQSRLVKVMWPFQNKAPSSQKAHWRTCEVNQSGLNVFLRKIKGGKRTATQRRLPGQWGERVKWNMRRLVITRRRRLGYLRWSKKALLTRRWRLALEWSEYLWPSAVEYWTAPRYLLASNKSQSLSANSQEDQNIQHPSATTSTGHEMKHLHMEIRIYGALAMSVISLYTTLLVGAIVGNNNHIQHCD